MPRHGTLGPALFVLLCLSVAVEVLSGSTKSQGDGGGGAWGLASWLMSRGGSRAGDAAAASDWAPGVACWGPGVWPHPAHCSLFSVCRMTGSGVKGVLLRCPDHTAFITRRWRCYPDKRTNCGRRTIPPDLLKASMEMRIPRISLSPRLGLCPFPKPYCSSDTILTVCAPNHLLIGNVTCPTSCMEDEFGAFCDPEVAIETTTSAKPPTTASYSETLPILDANLMESAIKITSHLGLGPAPKNASNQTSPKPSGVRKPAVPAYTAPVFDLNGSPEEYSYETDQVDAEKPAFSKPTVVISGNEGSTTVKPLPTGNKDSDLFTIEKVQSSVGAVVEQLLPVGVGTANTMIPLKVPTTEKYMDKGEEDKLNAEKEKLEREKLEKEKLEREKLERERLEKERIEKERLEKEKLEKERLEKEKLEKERLEKEKLEKERLEKEKIEKERLENEKLEKERLEKEKLQKEKLEKEKLEKERLEKEKLEREKLEREKLEKEKLEKERLEKEKLEREKQEKEKLEKEKLEREKLEKERLEKERLEKEKLEKEKAEREKLEKERLEKEKLEKEKLEKEKLEKEKLEKLEKEKLEREKLEKEKLMTEKLEKEKLEKEKLEKEKLEKIKQQNVEKDQENKHKDQKPDSVVTAQSVETSPFSPHDLASVCQRPGLTCVNSNVLLECSSNLVPLRAWNCGSFFSRSATLIARCDREKDSCVAAVDGSYTEEGAEDAGLTDSRPLCERPGAQCADKATLIHCSDDLRSATVAVCADLFPGMDGIAFCNETLDACVVGIGDDAYSDSHVSFVTTTTDIPTQPIELPTFSDVTTPASATADRNQSGSNKTETVVPEKFPGKPYPSNDPNDTFLALFPMTKDQCRKPGLRCFGGRVLEACERGNPKPVYRMDCSAVLADSLDARCEEQSEGEATCMVALHRHTPLLKGGQLPDVPLKEEDIFTLELSVVDVTRTYEYEDSELPQWKCSRVGQYCADEGTLLSCSADLSVEFALSCGAIAPRSVVAFCDHTREACVVKKISDLTGGLAENTMLKDVANRIQNASYAATAVSEFSEPAQLPTKPTVSTMEYSHTHSDTYADGQSVSGPSKWEFSTISQLYPPDVPLGSYSPQSVKPHSPLEGSSQILSDSILKRNCSKAGPLCLDEFHLGSCSEELELRFILPCSALYTSDPAPFCDATLSACLPSSSRQPPTTAAAVITTKPYTTEAPTTTTTMTPTKVPVPAPAATTSQPSNFIPQQIPSYPPFNYPTPTGVQYGAPPHISNIQENQYANLYGINFPPPLGGSNFHNYAQLRPEAYTFFQRPDLSQYTPQQSRPPGFFQTLFQNYGVRWPSFSQTFRPPTLSSFPFLNNIIQSFSTIRPPGALQQNAEYGPHGGEEPYDYNDPQYQHYAEKYAMAPAPVTYHPILPGTQLIKEVERPVSPVAGGVSSDMQSDLLKYYTSMLHSNKQPSKQSTSGYSSSNHKNRPKPQASIDSYLNQFLELLRQQSNGNSPYSALSGDLFESQPPTISTLANYGTSRRPVVHKVKSPEVTYTPSHTGDVSQINPLTWVGKVEAPNADKTSECKRPGMQCVDSDSLGACSKDLKLRYVIPCRHLLPFVSVGKPFCDMENDACGVIVDEEKAEYPTDFTSYP